MDGVHVRALARPHHVANAYDREEGATHATPRWCCECTARATLFAHEDAV
jgi:hypothetical protein